MFLDMLPCSGCGRDWPGTRISKHDPEFEQKKAAWIDWVERLKRDHELVCPGRAS